MEAKLKSAFAAGKLAGLHSFLALRRGAILAEVYFDGEDQNWGRSLGVVAHGPDRLHDLRSVTKSITGLLYGIALADGLVPGLDAVLVDQFPDYPDLAKDPQRREILVRHALSMQMGTEWDEGRSYDDRKNSEIAMELADDRYRFALGRPMVTQPGTMWTYNGGATALIARLIVQGTGMTLEAFARQRLFAPLGITEFEWAKGSDGVASAASGLRLTNHDLAKIGQMVLAGGRFEGREIAPKDWLDQCFTPQADLDGIRYGLFWWLASDGTPPNWVAGFGNGGQRMMIHPRSDVVLVVFAGSYNDPEAWRLPVRIITDFLVPVLEAG